MMQHCLHSIGIRTLSVIYMVIPEETDKCLNTNMFTWRKMANKQI